MKLDQAFDVAAPIEDVWRALNDLERVAPCLPGATITLAGAAPAHDAPTGAEVTAGEAAPEEIAVTDEPDPESTAG
jgi:hypothetical protein